MSSGTFDPSLFPTNSDRRLSAHTSKAPLRVLVMVDKHPKLEFDTGIRCTWPTYATYGVAQQLCPTVGRGGRYVPQRVLLGGGNATKHFITPLKTFWLCNSQFGLPNSTDSCEYVHDSQGFFMFCLVTPGSC